MQEDLAEILKACAVPKNNEDRLLNEKKIREFKKQQPEQFVVTMSEQLNNTQLNESARHLAGVLFKNSVKAWDPEPFWFSFSEEAREELKTRILAPLADESASVRLSACSCVATVACLELPRGEWTKIIDNLCSNSYNEEVKIKQSSLKTLGYICEELDSHALSKEQIDLVITALLEALVSNTEHDEIMKISIEAVLHSLMFAESIFYEGKGGIIVERVLACAYNNYIEVRTTTMMCLAEIVRLYYQFIDDYMSSIKEVTFKLMREDAEDVGTLAIEVWCSLCEEEIYHKKKGEQSKEYVVQIFSELLPLMLQLLNDSDIEEEDDSDTWNRSTAAGCCLHLMAQNVGDEIIQDVISFVESKIGEGASWKDKYFGLLALGAILEGPSKQSLINVLAPAMGIILTLYADESRKVRETAAWFFSKVAQNHAELLGTESFFPSLYEYIMRGLKDETRVACNSASIITELAKSLKPVEGQNRNILSSCYTELISNVVECAYRKDEMRHGYGRSENKITIAGFDALYSLFENAPQDVEPLLMKSLEHFYEKMKETNVTTGGSLDERATDLQSFLCVCIQTILNRIDQQLSEEVCSSLVDVIIQCFDARGDVFEEGFLLLSALCSKFGALMDKYVEKIGPYIFHGLKESDSSDTIKNACGLISDLCTMVESQNIISGFHEYVPLLLQIMTNRSLQRDAKLGAVTAIGDTYLMTKEKFLPFLDNTLELFASAANQCIDVNTNDDDFMEYVVKLQGALIESYTWIIQEVASNQDDTYKKLEVYVPDIVKFCIICVQDKFSPTMSRIKEVAGLIGDLASIYQKKEYFEYPEVETIVQYLKEADDEDANSIADWIINAISNTINTQ